MAEPYRDKWAILVGPTEYKHITPLRYCDHDVIKVGETLRDRLEFRDDHVLEFCTGRKYLPECAVLYNTIKDFLTKQPIEENDLLLFYFSGHGQNDGKDYLLPVDATWATVRKLGLAVEELLDMFASTKCKNVVMFIDACRNNGAPAAKGGVSAIGEASEEIIKNKDVVTFFSCEPREKSYEIEALQHGSFTHCLLQALNSGQNFTASQIYQYLADQLPLINTNFGQPTQRPYAVMNPSKKDMPLVFSSKLDSDARSTMLIAALADLQYSGWLIDVKYFDAAIELLNIAAKAQLEGDEAKRFARIEDLCAKRIGFNAFKAAWDAIDRGGKDHGKPTFSGIRNLGPLS